MKLKKIGITIAILSVLIGISYTAANSTWSSDDSEKPLKDREVITLEPGANFTIEINSKEWSPWLNASYNNMHTNIKIPADRVYQYQSGAVDTVRKDNSVRLKSDIYRIKTLNGECVAVVQTAMHAINKDLFN